MFQIISRFLIAATDLVCLIRYKRLPKKDLKTKCIWNISSFFFLFAIHHIRFGINLCHWKMVNSCYYKCSSSTSFVTISSVDLAMAAWIQNTVPVKKTCTEADSVLRASLTICGPFRSFTVYVSWPELPSQNCRVLLRSLFSSLKMAWYKMKWSTMGLFLDGTTTSNN